MMGGSLKMANDNLYNLSKAEHNIYLYKLDTFVYLHICFKSKILNIFMY